MVMGGVGILLCILVFPAMLLPAMAEAKARAQSISCMNQMKQVGLAFHIWANDHNDGFPNTVSTNAGGTLELAVPQPDGFDAAAFAHFRVLSNELTTAQLLVCPADKQHQTTTSFANLQPQNVTYQMRFSTNSDPAPSEVLCVCPIHGNELRQDGSVIRNAKAARSRP
jgi:hypothetical protein